jgi:uncharacterized protein YndB with AHSA1/START domain
MKETDMPNATLTITTPSDRELAMTRVFDAPRTLVFDALTKPELVKRWLGVQRGWKVAVCEIDPKVGGKVRYVWRHDDGREMGMSGVVREIVRPERFVHTEQFDNPWYEGEAVDTAVLVERDGKTTLTTTVLYETKEIRDAVLRSPMDQGISASYEKLDELLATGVPE